MVEQVSIKGLRGAGNVDVESIIHIGEQEKSNDKQNVGNGGGERHTTPEYPAVYGHQVEPQQEVIDPKHQKRWKQDDCKYVNDFSFPGAVPTIDCGEAGPVQSRCIPG